MIPIYQPYLPEGSTLLASQAIESGWISSRGGNVCELEKCCKGLYNAKAAVAVSNGTCGLHLIFYYLKSIGKERVLLPDITYIATFNSAYTAGLEVVLIDIDPLSWNIDLSLVNTLDLSDKDVLCLVDLYGCISGNSAQLQALKDIGVTIVSDSAESFGNYPSSSLDRSPFIDFQLFSFYGNKTVTTGEGGMILAFNSTDGDILTSMRSHSQAYPGSYEHTGIGFNYRLNNISAGLGVAQINLLPEIIAKKRVLYDLYVELFSSPCFNFLEYQDFNPSTNHHDNIQWLFTLRSHAEVDNHVQLLSDLKSHFHALGIDTRPGFIPVSKQAFIDSIPTSLVTSSHVIPSSSHQFSSCSSISRSLLTISLPSYPGLVDDPNCLNQVTSAIAHFQC